MRDLKRAVEKENHVESVPGPSVVMCYKLSSLIVLWDHSLILKSIILISKCYRLNFCAPSP